jgi:hypothetical protein
MTKWSQTWQEASEGHTQGPSMPELDTLHRCFLPSLAPFGQAVSEEKIFLTLDSRWLLFFKVMIISL